MMRLSLVIPCYNESESLPRLVERCARAITRNDIEVVFVDNGSTDSTSELIEVLLRPHSNMRSVRVPENQGYGCYVAPRVSYAPRKYAESIGNSILQTSYTAKFLPTPSGLGDRFI